MNSTNTVTASQALQHAAEAIGRGDKRAARQWAQRAASLAPQNEEPWLMLASVSTPQASVEYIKQALIVRPGSERAMQALRWAQKRVAEQSSLAQTQRVVTVPLEVTQPTRIPSTPTASPKKATGKRVTITIPTIFFVLMLCAALLVLSIWPGNASRALGLIQPEATSTPSETAKATENGPAWSTVEISKPTYTPIPTATSTPTAIPTPTALPTDMPTTGNTSAPAAQVPSNGKYILVSISEQHLYAYQDNKLVYSFIASTGIHNGTRTGVFQVLDKIPNAYGATWDLWMPNWMGIYYSGTLENGIHALPILSNGTQLWAGYLGTPISFGCIVLGVQESQLLYDWAEVGTTVEIKY